MAVTVQRQMPFVVLDERDLVVEVGSAAESQFGPLRGRVMWDCFPGAEALFKPYYDTARRSGEDVEFVQFYGGYVVRVTATPTPDGLLVSWEQLARLDVTTFASFRDTLVESLELIEKRSSGPSRDEAHRALRLIEGGG